MDRGAYTAEVGWWRWLCVCCFVTCAFFLSRSFLSRFFFALVRDVARAPHDAEHLQQLRPLGRPPLFAPQVGLVSRVTTAKVHPCEETLLRQRAIFIFAFPPSRTSREQSTNPGEEACAPPAPRCDADDDGPPPENEGGHTPRPAPSSLEFLRAGMDIGGLGRRLRPLDCDALRTGNTRRRRSSTEAYRPSLLDQGGPGA